MAGAGEQAAVSVLEGWGAAAVDVDQVALVLMALFPSLPALHGVLG